MNKKNIAIGIGSIIYAISPIDLLPEAVLGPLGYGDDAVVLAYGISKLMEELDKNE